MVNRPDSMHARRLCGWLAVALPFLPSLVWAQGAGKQTNPSSQEPVVTSAPEAAVGRFMLMTVTDATAMFTWETNRPAETVIRYGTEKDHLDQAANPGSARNGSPQAQPGSRRFQSCELRDLKPGTTYYYACHIGDTAASGQASGRFTTLTPPPGEELFSFATMTDTHVGQQLVAKLSLKGKVVSEGVRWPEPSQPFWRLAVGASIDEINASGVAFTIIKGDLTDGSTSNEFPQAKQLFDRLKKPYRVVHGNHDAAASFLRTFNLAQPWYSFDERGIHFVVLDTEPLVSTKENPTLDKQLTWLKQDLTEHAGQWTLVFLHRPIPPKLERSSGEPLSEELLQFGGGLLDKIYGGGVSHRIDIATGSAPSVSPKSARRLVALLREHGRVAGVFAGHLHRNYIGYWPEETGNLPYVETASTKEYPCGYAITRVFTGGYMQSYYSPRDPQCLRWSAMTQDAYAWLGFQSKAGEVTERNFVVRFEDLQLVPEAAPARK